MLRSLEAAAAVVCCVLVPASPAFASGADVIRDCNDHGHLTKRYSQREYRQALAQMPADVRQYTDCEDIIRRAQLGETPTQDPAANSGNPTGSASPEEVARVNQQIAEARRTGGAGQRIAGDVVYPGSLSFTKVSAAVSELPTPLIVLVALLVAGGVALWIPRLRRRGDGNP